MGITVAVDMDGVLGDTVILAAKFLGLSITYDDIVRWDWLPDKVGKKNFHRAMFLSHESGEVLPSPGAINGLRTIRGMRGVDKVLVLTRNPPASLPHIERWLEAHQVFGVEVRGVPRGQTKMDVPGWDILVDDDPRLPLGVPGREVVRFARPYNDGVLDWSGVVRLVAERLATAC